MPTIFATRLARSAAIAATLAVVTLTGTAAQAASASASPRGSASTAAATASPAYTPPAGVVDPCPPDAPGDAGCATLISEPAAGTAAKAASPAATAASTPPAGLTPADLQKAYGLQSATSGSGHTVAIVSPYDDPSAAGDLTAFRTQYGLPPCTVADGCFKQVSQTGTSSLPPTSANWEAAEVSSAEIVSAICENCRILIIEANSTAITDLGAAENEAVTLGSKFLDNDWYIPEAAAETDYDTQYFNHPGVAITAPSDDSGFGSIDYPAASPYVTSVGGTILTADSSARGFSETAWAGSVSGCSQYETKPAWQTDTGCAGRALNDISADAGGPVVYYDTPTEAGWGTVQGTSVAAAIIAAAYADAGTPGASDYPASYPYRHPGGGYTTPGTAYPYTSGLNNITTGSDGTCSVAYLCTAGAGYNGPTGLGSPASTVSLTSKGGQAGIIYSGITDKCVDDKDNATTAGTPVQLYSCNNGGASQAWDAEPDGTLQLGTTGQCAAATSTASGTGYLVALHPCNSADPDFEWAIQSNGGLYNKRWSDCLADPSSSTTDGTQLIVGACNGSASQQWAIPYTRTAVPGTVKSHVAGVCLHDSSGLATDNNPVDIFTCNGGTSETGWTVEPDGTLQYGGYCAVPQNAGTADSTPIVLFTCEGETTQFWTERSDGTFINKVSQTCLTDPDSGTVNSTQLYLLHCNTGLGEGWTPNYPTTVP